MCPFKSRVEPRAGMIHLGPSNGRRQVRHTAYEAGALVPYVLVGNAYHSRRPPVLRPHGYDTAAPCVASLCTGHRSPGASTSQRQGRPVLRAGAPHVGSRGKSAGRPPQRVQHQAGTRRTITTSNRNPQQCGHMRGGRSAGRRSRRGVAGTHDCRVMGVSPVLLSGGPGIVGPAGE